MARFGFTLSSARFLPALFQQLYTQFAAELLTLITRKKAGWIVRDMGKNANEYLKCMKPKEANEIKYLSSQDPITAGGMMEIRFQKFYLGLTVKDVIDKIRKSSDHTENIFYIYIVDIDNEIEGILSIQSIIKAEQDKSLASLMTKKIIKVRETDFRDDVALKMEKYHLLALPVVDNENRIKGVVTIHDVLKSVMIFLD